MTRERITPVSYAENLKHPKWQEKRLRIFERAGFKCVRCHSAERSLHAHHKVYLRGHKPWEYEDDLLECLCELCHEAAHTERDELDWIIAKRPTSDLPRLTDAVAAALTHQRPIVPLSPKAQTILDGLTVALASGDSTALIDAQNQLQDLIDEQVDFRRGPGGSWRQAA